MARDDQTKTGTIPASGTLSLTFVPTRSQRWDVLSCSINAPNVGGSAVGRIFRDSQFVSFFIAQNDTVEGVSIPVGPGRKFIVQWTGATVGATVQATIWYEDGETHG